jgi:hypothetical protein
MGFGEVTERWRGRAYGYVGPAESWRAVRSGSGGRVIRTLDDFAEWVSGRAEEELTEPFASVVDADGRCGWRRGAVSMSRAPGEGPCSGPGRSP